MPPVITLPSPLTVDPQLPSDPEFRDIALDVLADVKAEFVQAAAGDTDGPVFATRYLATRSAPTQLAYLNSARRVQSLPPDVLEREFSRHAITIGKTPAKKPVLHLPPEVVEQLLAKIAAAKAKQQAEKAHQQDLTAGLAYQRMRLVVERVKCIDDSDEWGDDEINIGGQYIGPSGSVVRVDQFVVFKDADAGDVTEPKRIFADWALETDNVWPKVYTAVLVPAEKDGGGFAKFLTDLWNAVKDKAIALIGAGVGALVGTEIMPVLGTIIGAVVGAFVGWLISMFDNPDDIMPAKVLTMTLGASTKSYYDWAKLTSPAGWTHDVTFGEDGSKYVASLSWRVHQH